ncbi:MAG: toxin-antitoxin system YwqK family antitoxin, partial [Bacteroidales bacterium]
CYMRKVLLFMALVVVPGIAFVQTGPLENDTVFNNIDKNGLKQGFWKKYYPNGKINYSGFFKDNKPVGTMKRYFESGNLKAIMNFDSTGTFSETKLFYEDGQLAAEGYYYNAAKDSLWKYYSYYEGTLISDEMYRKGVKHGMSHKYYTNGYITEKTEWKDNNKCGVWEQYYENRSPRLKGSYLKGKLSGAFIVYYPNGDLQVKGHYKDGKRHGRWIFYNKGNKVDFEVNFINGKAENEETLTKKQQEFFQKVDKNIGKFREPVPEDFFHYGNNDYER